MQIKQKNILISTFCLLSFLILSTFYFLPLAASAAARIHMPPNYLRVGASSLIGHWTFDGIDMNWSTNKASDKSGSGNSGTLTNMSTTTSPVKGKIGQALTFDGVNDYIDAGSAASLDNLSASDFTVTAWIKPAAIGYISGKMDNPGGVGWYFQAASNYIEVLQAFSGTNGWWRTTAGTLQSNTWQHVAFTYNAGSVSNDPTFYINGVAQSIATEQTPVGTRQDDAAVSLAIGQRVASTADGVPFTGQIDDVRVYNSALSANEVLFLYRAGAAKASTGTRTVTANAGQNARLTGGLVGLWSFNGNDVNWTANQALDQSGNANHGTLVSMSTTTSPAKGKIGQALTFDGTDDYINVGTASTYNFTSSDFSVAFWIYRMEIAASVSDMLFSRGVFEQEGWQISMCNCDQAMAFTSYQAGATQYVQITNGPRLNEWDHAVFVRSGSVGKWYINGVEATLGLNDAIVNPVSSNQSLTFMNGDPNAYPKARMDEVRIYNRALSAAEILQLYDMGK